MAVGNHKDEQLLGGPRLDDCKITAHFVASEAHFLNAARYDATRPSHLGSFALSTCLGRRPIVCTGSTLDNARTRCDEVVASGVAKEDWRVCNGPDAAQHSGIRSLFPESRRFFSTTHHLSSRRCKGGCLATPMSSDHQNLSIAPPGARDTDQSYFAAHQYLELDVSRRRVNRPRATQ